MEITNMMVNIIDETFDDVVANDFTLALLVFVLISVTISVIGILIRNRR